MSYQGMVGIIKRCFWIFFITAGLFFWSNLVHGQSVAYKVLLSTLYDSDFPTIKPVDVANLSSFQILDTRELDEYKVSHLEGAKWVGYDTFKIESVSDLDMDKPVLVYCTVGARSEDIGKKLSAAGFTQVFNLYGGIIHWSNEAMPLYQNGKLTTQVHTYTRMWGIWLEKGEKVY